MKKYIVLACVFMLVLSFSGCMDGDESDEDNKMLYYPDPEEGDEWTIKRNGEDGFVMTLTMEIVDTDASYEGKDAVKSDVDINMENYENETVEFKGFSGEGTMYRDSENMERLYSTMELTGTYYFKEYDNNFDVTLIIETDYDYTGKSPEKIEVGDEWSITETDEETTTLKHQGEIISEETETEITTKNYEVVEETEITVNAGTFDTMKIEWEDEDGSQYATEYFSEKAKVEVKTVKNTDDGTSTIELMSYDVN